MAAEGIAVIHEKEILENAAARIDRYLYLREEPRNADTIFVFGGSSLAPVEKAAELYNAGYAPNISCISQGGTFGGESIWGMPEAEKYHERLLELGVPEQAIIYETDREQQTRNTKAESIRVVPFLREHNIDPKTMILVSKRSHQRRAFDTIRHFNLEDIEFVNCPADEPFDPTDNDQLLRLVQEMERMYDYGKRTKTQASPEGIDAELLQATAIVRSHLRKIGIYKTRKKPPMSQN